jgi:hypothetical protein
VGNNRRQRRARIDIRNADKKLRQAEFFLSHLRGAPDVIADALAKAGVPDQCELLDFYFSACLTASKSAYSILEKAAGRRRFETIEHAWRMSFGNDICRARFKALIGYRDDDVHFGETEAESLRATIPADQHVSQLYNPHNTGLLGLSGVVKQTNPDGTVVTATATRGTMRLYLNLARERVDAETACRDFIEQLRSLQKAVLAALSTP